MRFSAKRDLNQLSSMHVPLAKFLEAQQLYRHENYKKSLAVLDSIWESKIALIDSDGASTEEFLALYGWNLFFLKDLSLLDLFFESLGDFKIDEFPKLHLVKLRGLDQQEKSLEVLAACNDFISENSDPISPLVADFLFAKGMAEYRLGNTKNAIDDLEISFALFSFRKSDFGMGWAGNYLGFVNLRMANYPESLKWFNKTLKSYTSLGLLQKQSMVLLNTGITHYKTGNYTASLDVLNRSHEIGVSGKWAHRQVFSNIALGNVHRILRDFEVARKHLHSGYSQAQSLGFPREEALALEFLGDVYRDEGQTRDAYRFYARARAIALEIAPKGDIIMEVHRRMGECHLQEGEPAEALAELGQALKLSRDQRDRYEEAVTLRVMARASRSIGDLGRAGRNIEKSVAILQEIGSSHELAISQLMWVDILVADLEKGSGSARSSRNLNQAWDLARSALDLCLQIDIRWWTDQARRSVQRVSSLRAAAGGKSRRVGQTSDSNSTPAYRPEALIIHTSTVMSDLLQLCDMFAATNEPVLITGETGTGKELIARRVHHGSQRAEGHLVPVNVSAIPAALFEREFFGHTKGAYSGADQDGLGFAGRADGGTLFLDEIGDLPLEVQPKLLRLLQDGTYQALGDPQPRASDLRLIAATNADLGRLVQEGKFRADLYYRLKILELEVVPVRKRREDILLLLRHFLSAAAGQPVDLTHYFDQASLDRIQAYSWPGNVREIAMVARRASVELMAKGRIQVFLVGEEGDRIELTGPKPKTLAAMATDSRNGLNADGVAGGELAVSESVERSRILLALEESGGSKVIAARRLGLSRSTLYRRLRRLEILSKED
jgi:DNA-binding NtrC family response regulator/tetratricopeptide (TPR) repeat protein